MMGGGPRQFMLTEAVKPRDVRATLSRLGSLFKPFTAMLFLVAALIIASTWTQVTSPELIGQAVDCYLSPAASSALSGQAGAAPGLAPGAPAQPQSAIACWFGRPAAGSAPQAYIDGLGQVVLVIVGLYLAGSILTGLTFYVMSWTGQHVLRDLRTTVFRHLHQLSLSYYSENEAGNVMSRLTNDMDTLQQAISFALVNVASGSLLLVWVAYKMLSLSLPYGLISMLVVPLMAVATSWFSSRARKAYRRTRIEIGKVNADLQESISGVREAQAFNREEANIESFRQSNAANRDANIQAVAFTAALAPTLEAMGYLALAIVTVVGGLALTRGQDLFGTVITVGLIVTFLNYVQRFNQPVQQISVLWTNIQSAIAGAERIFALLDTVPAIQDQPGAQAMPAIQGRVAFEHVDAFYKPDDPVLEDVSFTAEPGQTIAIVGPTGAGKTTLVNLLPRFYDVASGRVTIDGIDVRTVTRASLRRQIGVVLQDTFLFSDTVINNIRFGKPDAADEQVKAAAALVHADDFIQRLPQGYETILGEHGAGLSQGQRQLIAIARAALTDPRILILDEATSSIDTRTERLIQQALETLLTGRTSFVIAHRLSTIRNADQVLVIQDGKLVERGRHAELLALKGAYYNLYMKQFRQENAAPESGAEPGPSAAPGLAAGQA